MEKKDEKLTDALLKVALGFQVSETVEEFAEVDGELKLTKRKRTKKDVPPDLKAVQLLLGEREKGGLSAMTDEELAEEKERLLRALGEAQKTDKKEKKEGHVCVETKGATVEKTTKTAKKTRVKPRKRVVRKTTKKA